MVPSKVGFFVWEASWGQLKRRRRPLANRCYLCERVEETIEHLMVHYPQARMFWELILAIVGRVDLSFFGALGSSFLARSPSG